MRELMFKGGLWLLVGGILLTGATGVLGRLLGLSHPAAVALAVTLIATALWISEAIPLFVTGLVILLLNVVWLTPVLGKAGQSITSTVFMSPFFSNVILLFLGGFVISSAFHKFLIDERLARWVLGHTGETPSRVLLGVMLATAFLSMWMSNTATTAMMLTLAVPLLRDVEADDPYRRALLIGIPFAANLGGLGTPIGSPPNAIAMQYMAAASVAPSFAAWMVLALPVLSIVLLACWGLLLRIYRPRAARIVFDEQSGFSWTGQSGLVIAVALATALGWLTSDLHGVPTGIVGLAPVLAFFGTRLLDVADFRHLSWDVLILVGGGLSLGVAVQTSGLADWFVSFIPSDVQSVRGLAIVLSIIAGLMTSVMSNTATANLIIPVVIGLSDLPVGPLLMSIAYACSLVMVHPVSTPPNAMAFGTGGFTVKDMMIPGLFVSLLGLILTASLGHRWWQLWSFF